MTTLERGRSVTETGMRAAWTAIALLSGFWTSLIPPAFGSEKAVDAIVRQQDALVRSGPGDRDFYPTLKLPSGFRVRVLRDEGNGWLMIEPPEGSYSLIRSDYVQKTGDRAGVVTVDTMDRIGSELHKGDLYIRHQILRDEQIEILGEQIVKTDSGDVPMLRIKPPKGEYRYIARSDVELQSAGAGAANPLADRSEAELSPPIDSERPAMISLDDPAEADSPVLSGPSDSVSMDNFRAMPLASTEPEVAGPAQSTSSPKSVSASGLPGSAEEGIRTPQAGFEAPVPLADSGNAVTAPERQRTQTASLELERIDERFRAMIRQPIGGWDLAAIEREYRTLANEPGVERQVAQRMAAVDRYRRTQSEFHEFQQIIQQTDERDEALRRQFASRWQTVSTGQPSTTIVRRANSSAATPPVSAGPVATPPGGPAIPGAFDGAGIIQRAAATSAGMPRHVLLAPNGRVLAYLQAAPGVNLDQFVGQSMGLIGPRAFHPQLNADVLTVQRLAPVRLKR